MKMMLSVNIPRLMEGEGEDEKEEEAKGGGDYNSDYNSDYCDSISPSPQGKIL